MLIELSYGNGGSQFEGAACLGKWFMKVLEKNEVRKYMVKYLVLIGLIFYEILRNYLNLEKLKRYIWQMIKNRFETA